ncbi:MAG: universal stress protein [Eggerthellaceae bacterium]|nr:universal stress protein [Eggerthellaceae bacterium]
MYKKVLVPYDKSDPARHALAEAIDLVKDVPDASVTVLNVVDWHDYNAETFKIASRMSGVLGDSLDMTAIADVGEEAAREETERVAADIADIVAGTDVVDISIVNGSPHDTITAYAAEGNYDCIVMGHRGLGAVRGMLGSVCYSVLHKTNKPVLIVK